MLNMLLIFFKIGIIAFGGGWSIVGMIKDALIANNYVTLKEFNEMVTVAQMTPGPVALNMATYVGYKFYGFFGALLNTTALVLPPVIIFILYCYFGKYIKLNKKALLNSLKLGTVLLVFISVISLAEPYLIPFDFKTIILALVCCAINLKTKTDPIILMLIAGVIGIVIY